MEVCLLMGRRREQKGKYWQTNPTKKIKSFVNSPLTNNINLAGRPTKIKWKIHALFRHRIVDLFFIVTRASKKKAWFWFCRINFDYYVNFCRKMIFFFFFFWVYQKGKIHTKLNHASKFTLMPNYSLVMYFMIWTLFYFHIFYSDPEKPGF